MCIMIALRVGVNLSVIVRVSVNFIFTAIRLHKFFTPLEVQSVKTANLISNFTLPAFSFARFCVFKRNYPIKLHTKSQSFNSEKPTDTSLPLHCCSVVDAFFHFLQTLRKSNSLKMRLVWCNFTKKK